MLALAWAGYFHPGECLAETDEGCVYTIVSVQGSVQVNTIRASFSHERMTYIAAADGPGGHAKVIYRKRRCYLKEL